MTNPPQPIPPRIYAAAGVSIIYLPLAVWALTNWLTHYTRPELLYITIAFYLLVTLTTTSQPGTRTHHVEAPATTRQPVTAARPRPSPGDPAAPNNDPPASTGTAQQDH